MNNLKNLIKACLVCALLWLALPDTTRGQHDGYTPYIQPVSEPYPSEDTSEDTGGGLPWWGWAILGWLVLGWLFRGDDSGGSSSSHRDEGYVIHAYPGFSRGKTISIVVTELYSRK